MLHAGQHGLGAGLRSRVLPDERGRQQAALLIVDPGQRLFQFCDQRLDALNGYFVRYLTCDIEYVGRKELLRILLYAALFFAILNNLHRQEATQIISFTLIFLAMGISLYAFTALSRYS